MGCILNEPIAPHIKRDFPRLRLDESIGTALERLRREGARSVAEVVGSAAEGVG